MKTTQTINGAKVTREWPKPNAVGVLDKIKTLIRKSAKEIVTHNVISVKDSHPGHGSATVKTALGTMTGGSLIPAAKQKPSALCKELTKLRKKGVRVLDFWREGSRWQIKVMA